MDSNATVKLITRALSTMASDKSIGRSEALRRSMVALIDGSEPHEAHPAYWAPFVVVGEGSPAGIIASLAAEPVMPSTVVPAPTKTITPKSRSKRPVPWTTEIWRQQTN